MEARISCLESFCLISIIMPYYGHTHEAFLVLSKLCVNSRKKLDEYYPEFRMYMAKYCFEIHFYGIKYAEEFPPCDLFRLKFTTSSIECTDIDILIKFSKNLIQRKGYYFCNHYMHEQVNIEDISILKYQVNKVLPYINMLQSIKVLNDLGDTINYKNDVTLMDKLIIDTLFLDNTYQDRIIPHFIDPKGEDFDHDMKPFRRFGKIYFENKAYISDYLHLLSKVSVFIKAVKFGGDTPEMLDSLCNPIYLKDRVQQIEYEINNHKITTQNLENI